MLMPFGKFKGKEIHEIHRGYLRWLLENCDLQEPLKTAIENGIEKIAWNPPPPFDLEVEADIRVGWWADGTFIAVDKFGGQSGIGSTALSNAQQ